MCCDGKSVTLWKFEIFALSASLWFDIRTGLEQLNVAFQCKHIAADIDLIPPFATIACMVNMAAAIYCGVAEQLARWMRMGIRMAHCCAGALVSAFKRAGMNSISASTLPAMWQQFLPATNQLFLPDAADRGGVASMSAGGNLDQLHLAIRTLHCQNCNDLFLPDIRPLVIGVTPEQLPLICRPRKTCLILQFVVASETERR